MTFTHRAPIIAITSLLALVACELPTKLGELSATDSDGTTVAASTADSTDGVSSTGQTGGPDPGTTSTGGPDPATTVGPDQTTGDTMAVEESETGTPAPCDLLPNMEECMQNGCVAHFGIAYDFPGCAEGSVFLGCSDPQDCDDAPHIFCKDGTDEIYKTHDGCHPAGYSECEPVTDVFCGQCEALDEAGCLAEPTDCQPIYGAPHVDVRGEVCVDYDDMHFLRCIANGGACPPNIPTICRIDQPDEPYDSPSGCIPLGFEECEGAGTPACM